MLTLLAVLAGGAALAWLADRAFDGTELGHDWEQIFPGGDR